jgi:hypothetical protein
MPFDDWSTNPANNTLVGSINWSEGQLPGTVNGSARQMMADCAVWRDSLYSGSHFALITGQIFTGTIQAPIVTGTNGNFSTILASGSEGSVNIASTITGKSAAFIMRSNGNLSLLFNDGGGPSEALTLANNIGPINFLIPITRNGNTVWDAGNDGPGSGLNADLLDGFNATDFDRVTGRNLIENGGFMVFSDGRKECWGYVDVAQDSYATFNLPVAHTSWVNPSIACQARLNSSANENTGVASIVGSPPTGVQIYNAENQTLRVWVRTMGV